MTFRGITLPALKFLKFCLAVVSANSLAFSVAVAQEVTEGLVAHGTVGVGSDGAGTNIGVIAYPISQAKLDALIAAGELPQGVSLATPASVVTVGDSDVGLDMMQVLSEMAPAASLTFVAPMSVGSTPAVAPTTCVNVSQGLVDTAGRYTAEGAFLCALEALLQSDVDLIVDGYAPVDEAPFYDGSVSLAVSGIAKELPYIVAAGNSGSTLRAGSYVANTVYEAPFNGVGLPAGLNLGAGYEYVEQLHGFSSSSTYLTITQDLEELCLYWADAPGASVNDYELFVIEAAGSATPTAVLARSTDFQYSGGGQEARECISDSSALTINRRVVVGTDSLVAENRFIHIRGKAVDKVIQQTTPIFSMTTGGAVQGRAGLPNVVTVGSAPAPQASGNYRQFKLGDAVSGASSAGDRTVFYSFAAGVYVPFGEDQDDLATSAVVRAKPDVTGADKVSVSRVSGSTVTKFQAVGSEVATAHIGGLVVRSKASYGLLPGEVANALKSAAVDLGLSGRDTATGYGAPLLQATIEQINRPPSPPVNSYIEYGTASAVLYFSDSADDGGADYYSYGANCYQLDSSGNRTLVYSSSSVMSGQSFTIQPGSKASCDLLTLKGDVNSEVVVAQGNPTQSAGQLAKSQYSVASDPNGFTIRYGLDPAGQHSTTLRCATPDAGVVVLDTRDPASTSSSYSDLTADVRVICNLTITSKVQGIVQEAASLEDVFDVVPDVELPSLPLFLLYKASSAKK